MTSQVLRLVRLAVCTPLPAHVREVRGAEAAAQGAEVLYHDVLTNTRGTQHPFEARQHDVQYKRVLEYFSRYGIR